jgi:hypothetical protein
MTVELAVGAPGAECEEVPAPVLVFDDVRLPPLRAIVRAAAAFYANQLLLHCAAVPFFPPKHSSAIAPGATGVRRPAARAGACWGKLPTLDPAPRS